MRSRPKLFFTFLSLSLVPLILLALLNYWITARAIDEKLRMDQALELADFKAEVSRLLSVDQDELLKLARSQTLRDYVLAASAAQPVANTIGLAVTPSRASITGGGADPIPIDLRMRLAALVNSQSHFSRVSLINRNKQQILQAEQPADARELVVLLTKDFHSEAGRPDDRVWSSSAMTVLKSGVLKTDVGSVVLSTVPIFAGNQLDSPQGALAGTLKLDPVFSEAVKGNKRSSSGAAATNGGFVFVVLDRSGRILYHSNQALRNQSVGDSMPYFQPVASQMFTNEEGRQFFPWPGNETYETTYSRIPALDVSAAVFSNHSQALGAARQIALIDFILGLLLSVVAAALLTHFWQRRARGIERVTKGVEAIAMGKLDHRIDLRSSDDLRPLADNVGLVTQQLRNQLAREAESRQFQSFVRLSAVLTHDLKNAIEALSLTVSNMERHFDNPDFRADAMNTLRSATEKLRGLVSRLSTPVNTLSGEHKLPQPVDLVPMLKRVSAIAKPGQLDHEIQINLPESLFALVDIERMDKVVENLIINALEAMAGKKGTLKVGAGETNKGKPFFSVSDTGEGMGPRFVSEKLFHPFATTKKNGVGLGLYTCREVVRANGGTIEVESRAGVGTTFRVVLPSAENLNRGIKK